MADTPPGDETRPVTPVSPSPQAPPPPYGGPPPGYGGPPPGYGGPPPGQWPQGGYGPPPGQPGTGLQPNVASALCYVFGWVTGLIFLLIEKENRVVRFHAIQAIGLGIAWNVLWLFFLPFFAPLAYLVGLAGFVLWIVLIVKAYQGEMIRLPVIGDIAARNAGI